MKCYNEFRESSDITDSESINSNEDLSNDEKNKCNNELYVEDYLEENKSYDIKYHDDFNFIKCHNKKKCICVYI
jgi:hypothetical protein